MNFCSDNTAGAAPQIMAALEAANRGAAAAYGDDPLSQAAEARIAALFETPAAVLLVSTGTAANAIGLAVLTPPWGSVFCHPEAHIQEDECGAPEFYSGGAKLLPLPDWGGKIAAADLEARITAPDHGVHHVRPTTVSITQATEAGTLYTVDEIAQICTVAHAHGLGVHMDGARFANAVAALGCTPAEMTWRAGIDALSFGATKNGAFAAEAVVLFDEALRDEGAYRRKRGGHLFSKMRFIAAQFDAYLKDGLWLELAANANKMAARLAAGLEEVPGSSFRHPVEANEIFVNLPETVIRGLEADGFEFHRWIGETATCLRLVVPFNTRPEDVDAFTAAAKRHAEAA